MPIPVLPPSSSPHHTVVESSTMLEAVSEVEDQETKDRIIRAWQHPGADNVIPITLIGLESNKISGPSCAAPVVALTQELLLTQNLGARGYWMLSVMRAVTMMPNSTVSARLLSSDHVGGELQLVFPISQEEFNSLLSGELEAEVRPIVVQDVVQGGVEDDMVDGSGEAPSFSDSPSTPRQECSPSPSAVEVDPDVPVVPLVENVVPIPVLPPSSSPHHTVVESSTMLEAVSEVEDQETEDRIIRAWQRPGADNVIPITLIGSESNKISGPSCAAPIVALTQESLLTQNLGARGYRMLSVMRAVTMMPNSTVSACLLSSDHVGGELQLVFPISQEEFDSLLSGELEAEVCPIMVQDVVQGGVEDDAGELKYSDGWVMDCSVADIE
ncbi:hypothetical protein BDM02DRAFT_3191825 [Thelephora ganbajun]|uniref:Uncharacterized protein n=1 Tax=Thelephora ganbajun TaxID=370292 RepID=A0ACB6Z1F0_THEGA|nr:hypothetical protein BDM02DRAFT_3191825 [Thelephora ganbajun]